MKDEFNEQDFLEEKKWKIYAKSKFFDILYVLFALFIASALTLAAILVGRSAGMREYDSIIIGLSSSTALHIIYVMHHLNKQDHKLKSEFPPLDQSAN